MNFLSYFVQNSDFATLARFVSPKFFDVMDAKALWRMGQSLQASHQPARAPGSEWAQLKVNFEQQLTRSQLPITLLAARQPIPAAVTQQPLANASAILVLFFLQIFTQATWILDFRPSRFTRARDLWHWQPDQYFFALSPPFLGSIRNLYEGFYCANWALFDQALISLKLLPAKAILMRHFGDQDQTAVFFDLKAFESTFAQIFTLCAQEKITLEPEFFILGLTLLGLYQNLQESSLPGSTFNVRQCFEEAFALAHPAATTSSRPR